MHLNDELDKIAYFFGRYIVLSVKRRSRKANEETSITVLLYAAKSLHLTDTFIAVYVTRYSSSNWHWNNLNG